MLVSVPMSYHGSLQRDWRTERLMSANGLSFEVPVTDFLLDYNMPCIRLLFLMLVLVFWRVIIVTVVRNMAKASTLVTQRFRLSVAFCAVCKFGAGNAVYSVINSSDSLLQIFQFPGKTSFHTANVLY